MYVYVYIYIYTHTFIPIHNNIPKTSPHRAQRTHARARGAANQRTISCTCLLTIIAIIIIMIEHTIIINIIIIIN